MAQQVGCMLIYFQTTATSVALSMQVHWCLRIPGFLALCLSFSFRIVPAWTSKRILGMVSSAFALPVQNFKLCGSFILRSII